MAISFSAKHDIGTAVGATVIIARGLYIVLRESRAGVSRNHPVLNARSRSGPGVMPRIGAVLRRSVDQPAELPV